MEKLLDTIDERQFYSCESFLSNPDTIFDDLPPIPGDIARLKLIEFLKVAILYMKDEHLVDIGQRAEKKKNGMLYNGRVTLLAWYEIATGTSFHALRAVNKDDQTILIEIKKVDMNVREIQKCMLLPSNRVLLERLK